MRTQTVRSFRQGERGFNLIESVLAIAITGVVILSVLSLFAIGRSNVYAGRQMTHAISVGTRIMEDLSAIPMEELLDSFNIADNTAMVDVTITPTSLPDSEYPDTIMRSTKTVSSAGQCTGATLITFANDPKFFLRRWYCQLQSANNKLPNGTIWLMITPRKKIIAADPLNPGNTSVATVTAVIRWSEGVRQRQLVLTTTKFNRPNPL